MADYATQQGLPWALDPYGAYIGGTDRESDEHFFLADVGRIFGVLKFRRHPGELHLAHILIAPDHQDKGHAGRLLDHFLAWVRGPGAFQGVDITCEITAADPGRVAAMLMRRGFKQAGDTWRLST